MSLDEQDFQELHRIANALDSYVAGSLGDHVSEISFALSGHEESLSAGVIGIRDALLDEKGNSEIAKLASCIDAVVSAVRELTAEIRALRGGAP